MSRPVIPHRVTACAQCGTVGRFVGRQITDATVPLCVSCLDAERGKAIRPSPTQEPVRRTAPDRSTYVEAPEGWSFRAIRGRAQPLHYVRARPYASEAACGVTAWGDWQPEEAAPGDVCRRCLRAHRALLAEGGS